MMVTSPDSTLSPFCSLNRGNLPFISPIFSNLGFPHKVYIELAIIFHNIRYITRSLSWTCTPRDLTVLNVMRIKIQERLVSLPNIIPKPTSKMADMDHELEVCRRAALFYVIHTLRPLLVTTNGALPLDTMQRQIALHMSSQSKFNGSSESSWSTPGRTAQGLLDLFSSGMMASDGDA